MTMTKQTKSETASTFRMRAVTQRAYGSADMLAVATIERPEIGNSEVLVEVVAAGIDRGVWHLMTGMPYLIRLMGYGFTKPRQPVPGFDVAGRVVAVGADVTRFDVGDEVFGIARGAFADYAAADEAKLAHKPEVTSFEQAAVAAVSGITALQALTTVGGLSVGQRVLVIGASGGVGSFAVQLAKALGATVTGVSSTAKLDLVRSLGADGVVDYTRQNIGDLDDRFDLVIDIGGRNPISSLRRVMMTTGTLVIVGGEGGGRWTGGIGRQLRAVMLSPFVPQRLTMFVSKEHHSFIEQLASYLESGEVVPAIGERFNLAELPDAIRKLEAGAIGGKSVIVVRGDVDAA